VRVSVVAESRDRTPRDLAEQPPHLPDARQLNDELSGGTASTTAERSIETDHGLRSLRTYAAWRALGFACSRPCATS
jgi:hypothetical protein